MDKCGSNIWAVKWSDENIEVLRDLIEKGANVNAKDETTGLYPLHYAVKHGYIRCAKLFLKNKANPDDIVDTHGERFDNGTALHLAAAANSLDMCELLIAHGADLCAKAGLRSSNPLSYAVQSGASPDVIKCLTSEESLQVDRECGGPIFDAVHSDYAEALELLLAFDDCHRRFPFPVRLAEEAACRSLPFLKIVFDFFRYDILAHDSGYRVMCRAVQGRAYPEKICFLIDSGCKAVYVDDQGQCRYEALANACHRKLRYSDELFDQIATTVDVESVWKLNRVFVRGEIKVDYPLATVISWSNTRRLAKLLDIGLLPNIGSWRHSTLLGVSTWAKETATTSTQCNTYFSSIRSCIVNYTDVQSLKEAVRVLIAHGAEVNVSRENEISSLVSVVLEYVRWSHEQWLLVSVYRMLVDAGADRDYRSAGSPFLCPDVVIAASVTGNEYVLKHTLVRNCSVTAVSLFADLLRLNAATICAVKSRKLFKTLSRHKLVTLVIQLRNHVAISVLTALQYAIKSPVVLSLCTQLDEKFSAKAVHLAIAKHAANINLRPEFVSHVSSHSKYDTRWCQVHSSFQIIEPLKHMCRVRIRETLSSSGTELRAKIAVMSLPRSLQNYLLYIHIAVV